MDDWKLGCFMCGRTLRDDWNHMRCPFCLAAVLILKGGRLKPFYPMLPAKCG